MIINGKFFREVKGNFSSFGDVKLFINVFVFLTILPLLIMFLSLPRLMNLLTPKDIKKHKKHKNHGEEKLIEKLVKFTDFILGRKFWIYNPQCLKRSLVLYHHLRKAGIDVYICFGVRINHELSDPIMMEGFEGHAWLEYDEDVFLEKKADRTKTYKKTYRFPSNNEERMNQVA